MRLLLRGALACSLLLAAAAWPGEAGFARIERDASGAPLALQTAIASYAPADGAAGYTVDLIGAVHVADRDYYAGLNERFTGYDALLFEMVVPEEPPAGGESGGRGGLSIISVLQNGMKDMLGLSFQLDEIDYGAANFVHADLSTRGLRESMEERDESLYVYFWRLVYASFDQYAKDPLGTRDLDLLAGLLVGEDENGLKIVVAEELLASMESGDIFGGEDGSALIAARNEHALGVLRRQIDSGKRRIGIFYGVAHLADLEERLSELGFARTGTQWLDAWDFRCADPP